MSVLVKLPGTVSGAELVDALEQAGGEIRCKVQSTKNMYYKPGSVQAQELNRSVAIDYVAETKTVRKGIFWTKKEVVPDIIVRIGVNELPTEEPVDQIEVNLTKFYRGSFSSFKFGTSDPYFDEIRPWFEKFLAALYRILEQGPQSLPPSPPPPPPPPDAPWYKPDKITVVV